MIERSVANAPAMAVRKRFGAYKPEPHKAVRTGDVKESEALRKMIDAWNTFSRPSTGFTNNKDLNEATKGIHYTAEDVERFCVLLETYQNEHRFVVNAGRFLSAFISHGTDSDYTIPIKQLDKPIMGLCMDTSKNVRVEGDLGRGTCWYAKGGSLTINGSTGFLLTGHMKDGNVLVLGNAGDKVGLEMVGGVVTINGNVGDETGREMNDGNIAVKGNAGNLLGNGMRGGTIVVDGDAGSDVGIYMRGGEIHLMGDFTSIGDNVRGGRIYHKGKVIAGK
jgi:formylmethanofuran dehydrogenase subunit C